VVEHDDFDSSISEVIHSSSTTNILWCTVLGDIRTLRYYSGEKKKKEILLQLEATAAASVDEEVQATDNDQQDDRCTDNHTPRWSERHDVIHRERKVADCAERLCVCGAAAESRHDEVADNEDDCDDHERDCDAWNVIQSHRSSATHFTNLFEEHL
jgi:hypothetical protein